jgi:signal transduction histidine kinase
MEDRILLLALRGRDSQILERLLIRGDHDCLVCRSGDEVADALAIGAGAALVTEESLAETDRQRLIEWLGAQPPWSDFPFILLATKRAGRRPREAARILSQLGNVVVLERPVHGETLTSAVEAALRARRRQYEARRHLEELQSAEDTLRQLNGTLEGRIDERTRDLSRVNNQLMQEIAERERAQAALVQSQKMDAMGQLTGGIAHDFNNLLTVIGGNLELIGRRANDERIGRLADYARQASERAGKLTRQLLAFSRSQRLIPEPVDVNVLLRGMDDLLGRTIGPLYQVDMQLDPSNPWAMADANQMELAILNLAINARDAMSGGGRLLISSEALAPHSVLIRVKDNGAGIPSHLLDRVFDPFFTTKPIGKGTGLGLSQVYGLLQQSGGSVSLESAEGVGTTVTLCFPAAPPAPTEAGPASTQEPESGLGRERVLVVEDDEGVRRFIVECLQSLGYAVSEASGGAEGLQHIRTDPPELLIVDYAMPGLTGVEVINEARRTAPNLPIILATGYADMDAVHRAIDPSRVLRKPFQIGELEAAIRGALSAAS